jgi:hypothetical protein
MQVLDVGFEEANAAYLDCPLRAADRELHDRLTRTGQRTRL